MGRIPNPRQKFITQTMTRLIEVVILVKVSFFIAQTPVRVAASVLQKNPNSNVSPNATIIDYVQCLHDDIDHEDAEDYLLHTGHDEFDPFAMRTPQNFTGFEARGYDRQSFWWPSFYHHTARIVAALDHSYSYYMPLPSSDRKLPVDCRRFRRAVFATKQLTTRSDEQPPSAGRNTGHVAVDSRKHPGYNNDENDEDSHVLFPLVFNLTAHAIIHANATCGINAPEVYCPLTDHVEIFRDQCAICDATNRLNYNVTIMEHNITNAIDNSSSFWMSPTLANGFQYQWVTITIDLRQVFLIAYVIIRSAISPRPEVWILERSLDGVNFAPWQYYAPNNRDCLHYFNTRAVPPNYRYTHDAEVACVTQFSGLQPLENGEVLTSLLNNRPGAREPSEELFNFTRARYIRIRLMKMRTLKADVMTSLVRVGRNRTQVVDPLVTRRYFYSFRDIAVGGMCICYGHSHKCDWDTKTQHAPCACKHNTCGLNCERCCPLYNQQPWQIATNAHPAGCEKCQCYNQADSCQYNSTVAQLGLSINMKGQYSGGGVCVNCRGNTRGINCQQCEPGYYRPLGVLRTDPEPCRICQCQSVGTIGDSTSTCVQDETEMHGDLQPGDCLCKPGFAGKQCDRCALGYEDFPTCRPCICNYAGTTSEDQCDGVARRSNNEIDIGGKGAAVVRTCTCKVNVEGAVCDRCRPGHFHLGAEHEIEGCLRCFCFGISDKCRAVQWPVDKVAGVRDWLVSDRTGQNTFYPEIWNNMNEVVFNPNSNLAPLLDVYYWRAPEQFLGNRLTSYGGKLQYIASYVRSRGDLVGSLTHLPDVVIAGNDVRIGIVRSVTKNSPAKRAASNETKLLTFEQQQLANNNKDDVVTASFQLDETGGWQFVTPTGSFKTYPRVDRRAIMTLLQNVSLVLIKASYQTHQAEMRLLYVALEFANKNGSSPTKIEVPPALVHDASLPVEQCECPFGYFGLSCEQCATGFRRVNEYLQDGTCIPCNCHNHTGKCDPLTGRCLDCQHNTDGFFCDRCAIGYYGDATGGRADSCAACACPLDGNQSVSNECIAGRQAGMPKLDYVCLNCPSSYTGYHCDECVDGYFGQPSVPGGKLCSRCDCSNNIDPGAVGNCDTVTGKCLKCVNNTAGDQCEKCKPNYYGDATAGNCTACQCFQRGSLDLQCNATTGECRCLQNYEGKHCDRCLVGHGGIDSDCLPCDCNPVGTKPKTTCDVVSGACQCQPGVFGLKCSQCSPGFYNFSSDGCTYCNCNSIGSANDTCDAVSGQCPCRPNVEGRRCDRCAVGSWNLNPAAAGHQAATRADELRVVSLTNHNNDAFDENAISIAEVDGKGCENCKCNKLGSLSYDCEQTTGQCRCRPGVTGRTCDQCANGFFGFSAEGCMACEPCNEPGHICDPFNGQCVCPPYTEGDLCDRCAPNAYDFRPLIGCKPCQCDVHGAYNSTCDGKTGQCSCKPGYRGKTCDACNAGYFSFPVCIPCRCNPSGTLGQRCTTSAITGRDVCKCDDNGQCPCRPNVEGLKCDKCKNGFFGLSTGSKNQTVSSSDDDNEGCLSCYCFGRSHNCIAARDYYWSRLLLPNQTVSLRYEYVTTYNAPDASIDLRYSQPQLPIMADNRLVLPHNQPEATIRLPWFGIADGRLPFESPLYWSLPAEFLGNKLASYGGALRFRVREFPPPSYMTTSGINDDEQQPLIILGGNQRVRLYWNPDRRTRQLQQYDPHYTALLWEKDTQWRARGERQRSVSRADFMTALQRVEFILIRAHPYVNLPERLQLSDAQMDEAVHVNRSVIEANNIVLRPAETIEQCLTCPAIYAGLSCQDPTAGYMRTHENKRFDSPDPAKMIGFATPCQCNNHSNRCNIETGECFDCADNTSGFQCEKCAPGYFGEPNVKPGRPFSSLPCRRCHCPTAELIASQQCISIQNGADYECQQCAEGYTGPKCNVCAVGYYGVPNDNIPCRRCACNPYGSLSPTTCDRYTGQCICSSEVYTGRDCGQCQYGFVVTAGGICLDCIGRSACFATLLNNDIRRDLIEQLSQNVNVSALSMAQWTKLSSMADRYFALHTKYQSLGVMSPNEVSELVDALQGGKFEDVLLMTSIKANTTDHSSEEARLRTEKLLNATRAVLTHALHDVNTTIKNAVQRLDAYYALASSEQRSTVQTQLESEATALLKRIHNNDEDPSYDTARDDAERELNGARSTVDRIQQMRPSYAKTERLTDRVEAVQAKLAEAHNLATDSVEQVAQSAVQKGVLTLREITTLEKLNKNIKELQSSLNATFTENLKTGNTSKARVQDALNNFEVVHQALTNLNRQRQIVATATSERITLNPQYEMEAVLLAELHSKRMLANASELQTNLASSRDAATEPLRAAQAYEKITQSVGTAREASQEALRAALQALELATPATSTYYLPTSDMNASDNVMAMLTGESMTTSRHLLEQAQKLAPSESTNVTTAGSSESDKLKQQLNVTRERLQNSTATLAETETFFRKLHDHVTGELQPGLENRTALLGEVNDIITRTTGMAEQISRNVDGLRQRFQQELMPEAAQLARGDIAGDRFVGDVERHLNTSRNELKLAVDQKVPELIRMADALDDQHAAIRNRIGTLRARILSARQRASSVQLSVTGAAQQQGVCVRQYEPNVQSSLANELLVTYATPMPTDSAILAFLSSELSDNFMALDIVGGRMRLSWRLADDSNDGTIDNIIHPLMLQESFVKDYTNRNRIYQIRATLVGTQATLSVRPAGTSGGNEGDLAGSVVYGKSSGKRAYRFDVAGDAELTVGGLPNSSVSSSIRKWFSVSDNGASPRLAGCVFSVTVNGERMGLWNFVKSQGCDACISIQSASTEPRTFRFADFAYARTTPNRRTFHSRRNIVTFEFKTFQPDALLFLLTNPNETSDFLSIELANGRLHYRFYLGGQSYVHIATPGTYNNGQWISVFADRNEIKGFLRVVDTYSGAEWNETRSPTPRATSGNSNATHSSATSSADMPTGLEVVDGAIFFGGTSPGFRLRPPPRAQHIQPLGLLASRYASSAFFLVAEHFTGCMRNLQVDDDWQDLLREAEQYNIQAGCRENLIDSATFLKPFSTLTSNAVDTSKSDDDKNLPPNSDEMQKDSTSANEDEDLVVYAKMHPRIQIGDDDFTFGLTFKTTSASGVLFAILDDIHEHSRRATRAAPDVRYLIGVLIDNELQISVRLGIHETPLNFKSPISTLPAHLKQQQSGGGNQQVGASSTTAGAKVNSLTIAKIGRSLEVRVNDVLAGGASVQLMNIQVDHWSGVVYLGGIPRRAARVGLQNENAASLESFEGCISSVIYGNRVVGFEQVSEFRGVRIGECRAQPVTQPIIQRYGPSTLVTVTQRSPSSPSSASAAEGTPVVASFDNSAVVNAPKNPSETEQPKNRPVVKPTPPTSSCSPFPPLQSFSDGWQARYFGDPAPGNSFGLISLTGDADEPRFFPMPGGSLSIKFAFKTFYPAGTLAYIGDARALLPTLPTADEYGTGIGGDVDDAALLSFDSDQNILNDQPSLGSASRHHVLVKLVEGRVEVFVHSDGRKERHFRSQAFVDDGQWHTVRMELSAPDADEQSSTSNKRQLTVHIDGLRIAKQWLSESATKIPARIYFAGVPAPPNEYYASHGYNNNNVVQHATQLPEPVAESLRGCLVNVSYDGNFIAWDLAQSVPSENGVYLQLVGARPCYQNVERSSYFDGNAYAAFGADLFDTFVISKGFTITFSFRAAAQSGMLVSAGDAAYNEPNLMINLVNGRVVFTIQAPSAQTGSVQGRSASITSERSNLCDNRFHQVRATYNNGVITLAIDDDKVQTHQNPLLDQLDTQGPLFVGGRMSTATSGEQHGLQRRHVRNVANEPASVESRGERAVGLANDVQNFVGCLQIQSLNGRNYRLEDFATRVGVLVDACPK